MDKLGILEKKQRLAISALVTFGTLVMGIVYYLVFLGFSGEIIELNAKITALRGAERAVAFYVMFALLFSLLLFIFLSFFVTALRFMRDGVNTSGQAIPANLGALSVFLSILFFSILVLFVDFSWPSMVENFHILNFRR